MRIGPRGAGSGYPAFIVAEGGTNHGGSLAAAIALTDAAAAAGASAMKWQLWLSADEMYDRGQFPKEWAAATEYRLPVEWLPALRDRAHQSGMAFGLSSFGFASLDVADEFVDFHKIASIEATWGGFVYAVERKRRPTLVSIGMQDITVGDRVNYESSDIILHCTVAYPCEISDVHLRSRRANSYRPLWGLSDHTTNPTIAPCAAVALGACVIEKHIMRLWNSATRYPYPDEPHSLDEYEFKDMVDAIRLTESAMGSSHKRIRESEQPYLKYRRGPRGLRGA